MAITSKRKEDAEHDHHQRDGLRAAHFAGAAGRGEAFGGRDVGNGEMCIRDRPSAHTRKKPSPHKKAVNFLPLGQKVCYT